MYYDPAELAGSIATAIFGYRRHLRFIESFLPRLSSAAW
jgi:hypothetical protein